MSTRAALTALSLTRGQAILVNGANLMGGSSEPDGSRGFGRVHLETTMPLGGEGDTALFVADSGSTAIAGGGRHEYYFAADGDAGVDLRATLAWIDPPASTASPVQLVHDLDLLVVSPIGAEHTMWGTGADTANVIERVIVPAGDLTADAGIWRVEVSSSDLTTTSQSYSLVVTWSPVAVASGESSTIRRGDFTVVQTAALVALASVLAASTWVL